MKKQVKAIAGAVAALIASLVPLLMAMATGSEATSAQVAEFLASINVLGSSALAIVVGWATVYFSPANETAEES